MVKSSIMLIFLLFTVRGRAQDQDDSLVQPLHSFSLDSTTDWLESVFHSRITDDIKVIGLGEVLHGGREIAGFKAKMVQYLVQKKNVRFLLFEYPNAALSILNYYLQENDRRSDDTLKVLAVNALSGSLYDKSFLNLLSWIKHFNLEHANDMVSLKGVDIIGASGSFSNYFMLNFSSLLDSNTRKEIDSEWNKVPINVITRQLVSWCHKNKDTVRIRVKKFYPELLYNIDNAEHDLLYADQEKVNWERFSLFRDSIMAKNVAELSTGRSVLWAHNLHITPSCYNGAGFALQKEFTERYYVIVTDFTQSARILVKKDSGMIEKTFLPDKFTAGHQISKKLHRDQGIVFYNDIARRKWSVIFGSIGIVGDYQILGAGKGFDALVLLSAITPVQVE